MNEGSYVIGFEGANVAILRIDFSTERDIGRTRWCHTGGSRINFYLIPRFALHCPY